MKHITSYEIYLIEKNKQHFNNLENMNEGIKHWLASFLMLVNLGLVPPRIMAADDNTKIEFAQSAQSVENVADKFAEYYRKNNFFNTPKTAWEDFQKIYGSSTYDLDDILNKTSIDTSINKEIPKPTNYVNDYADLVSPQSNEDALNAKLAKYEKESGMEIAILTINTLGGDDASTSIGGLATDVFHTWGIGKQGSNNGILIAIDEKEHKWEIRTGYGAEIVLPDALCSRFGRNVMVPEFKAGNYTGGIEKLVDAIIKQIGSNSADIKMFQKNYEDKKARDAEQFKQGAIDVLSVLALLGLIAFIVVALVKNHARRKDLLDRSQSLLNDIKLYKERFASETSNLNDLAYINKLIKDYEKITTDNYLTTKPTTNKDMIDRLFNYTKELGSLLSKVRQFNSVYSKALGADAFVKEGQKYLQRIKDIEKDLEYYNIKSGTKLKEEDFSRLGDSIKQKLGDEDLFYTLEALLNTLANVKSTYGNIAELQLSIPQKIDAVKNYMTSVRIWKKQLEDNNLSSSIPSLEKKVSEMESVMKLDSSEIMKQYAKFQEVAMFVETLISNEKNRLRRIREEEEEKIRRERRRKQDEEDAERRRRDSYYSSSSSSSSYSSSSSDSFGGFGGGDTGGGGSGGSW